MLGVACAVGVLSAAWAFGGSIETGDAKNTATAAVSVTREECFGKDPESVAKKMGLRIRESRTIDPEGAFGIDCYGTETAITTVFLGNVSGHRSDGAESLRILDVLSLPVLTGNQFFSHCADFKGNRDDELMGIGTIDARGGTFAKASKVWRASLKTGRFEEVPPDDVQLAVPTEEDGMLQ